MKSFFFNFTAISSFFFEHFCRTSRNKKTDSIKKSSKYFQWETWDALCTAFVHFRLSKF